MPGGSMTLTSVDAKDSVQFLPFLLRILTATITAGTGEGAFSTQALVLFRDLLW